jgi:hypothetical protein
VRRACSIACLFFAGLCAIGGVWNGVQVFAWSRMFAGYARELTVSEALRATFDPAKPCELCRAVSKARETERQQVPLAAERSAEKLLLAFHTPAQLWFLPSRPAWPAARPPFAPRRTEAVPVPPPRVRLA